MRLNIVETGLNKDGRVVADDGIDSGGLISRQYDTGQKKGDHIPALQQ